MIKAIVTGNLRANALISLYIDDHYVASTRGKARVKYTLGVGRCSKYLINVDGGRTYFHIDAIESVTE